MFYEKRTLRRMTDTRKFDSDKTYREKEMKNKITVRSVTFAYTAFIEPRAMVQGAEPRYSCCILIPKQARHYFCESLFWASQPKQATKITWQLMPTAPQFVLRQCHCVTSLQARCRLRDTTSNDLTAFRM